MTTGEEELDQSRTTLVSREHAPFICRMLTTPGAVFTLRDGWRILRKGEPAADGALRFAESLGLGRIVILGKSFIFYKSPTLDDEIAQELGINKAKYEADLRQEYLVLPARLVVKNPFPPTPLEKRDDVIPSTAPSTIQVSFRLQI